VMAALMLLPTIGTLFCAEPAVQLQSRPVSLEQVFLDPLLGFFRHNGVGMAWVLLLFVGCYKLPDQIIGPMAGPFYLDVGYSKADIATVSKFFGVWIGIAGALLGGLCVAMYGTRRMLVVAALGVALSNLAYLLMASFPSQLWAFYLAIAADNGAQGFSGTVLVAFIATMIQKQYTGTQFALMVSLAFLPGKLLGGISGMLVEATSFRTFFMLSTLSVIPTLLLLWWLWPRIAPKSA
jgi:MFS transporter, PAT family, beta-lactamase induction signal transducer AmpG